MRTNEERIREMHARAGELEREKRLRSVRLMQVLGTMVCLGLVILLAAALTKISAEQPLSPGAGLMAASTFAGSGMLGYLVIGIIAFILGVMVTIFSYRLKKWHDEDEDRD